MKRSFNRDESKLLELLHARYRDLGLAKGTWKRPVFGPTEWPRIERAARLHAQANISDPFAYARAKHYIVQGYETHFEVTSDATTQIRARQHKLGVLHEAL